MGPHHFVGTATGLIFFGMMLVPRDRMSQESFGGSRSTPLLKDGEIAPSSPRFRAVRSATDIMYDSQYLDLVESSFLRPAPHFPFRFSHPMLRRRGSAPPPRPPKGLLSLRDYTVVHAALEIVVHWGMAPMLEPGLGSFDFDKRPRSRAVKISRRVLQYWKKTGQRPEFVGSSRLATKDSKPAPSSSAEGSVNSPSLGAGRARAQLALCVGAIQGVVTTEQFQPMLLPLYLPDLLAARLQLVYGRGAAVGPPLDERGCRRRDRSTAPAGTRGDGGTTLNLSPPSAMAGGSRAARQPMEEALQNLLRDLGPREIMGALRQLLSEGARAPSWLRHHGGRMLSEIVLRPGGVQATLEVYLAGAWAAGGGGSADGGGSGKWSEGDGLKACQRVAKLLATPPKRVLPGEYVSRVAPQLAEMLHYDGQQRALITRQVPRVDP